MSLDLTGISNENEFYTHHYLSAILENDLKEVFKRWRERDEVENVQPPFARLRTLQRPFFTMRSQAEREKTDTGRLAVQRGFVAELCTVLGYPCEPTVMPLGDGAGLPVLGHLEKPNGAPELWLLEVLEDPAEPVDPLAARLNRAQFPEGTDPTAELLDPTLDDIITRQVFGRDEPPRWLILFGGSQVVLLDRTKWNQKRLLRFDLAEILGRREPTTLQATAALLHRDSVAPAEGLSLLDTLDERSHKHAHAVSEDLKYALREAIELLGNEAVYYLREVRKDAVFKDEGGLDEAQLTVECLRYMYRLLFLFYIEARPELGYAPMKAASYRDGYSLETLRDLELVKLTTEESRNGYFLDDSLTLLFRLIYDGFTPGKGQPHLGFEAAPQFNTFTLRPLRTHLFDPKRTPILNGVRFRNWVLQRIIELMSLSRVSGKYKRRGRISYAQLGINQLGAVYEALLSFTGFFAKTDLYEVKKAKDKYDELETGYFVPAEDLAKYDVDEKVYESDGSLKMYPRGTFIYRLAGRNRETSASYYTPEVLTRCLVKYALKELLGERPGDDNWKTADEILELTVCEPAMGSAAFLNEAIDQLADAYLERKQDELGYKLSLTAPREQDLSDEEKDDPHRQREDYAQIVQRVKMYIADRNVYGIDLNPVAVELAEVSLWLNTMAEDGFVPWFGNQLVCGNSLIGARRHVFDSGLLGEREENKGAWLDAVPGRLVPGAVRAPGQIYHFLVPDRGMLVYGDGNEGKPIREMAQTSLQATKAWRRDFYRLYSDAEVAALEKLSAAIDRLWASHTQQQQRISERTEDPLHVWGQPNPPGSARATSIEWKDKVLAEELHTLHVRNSSPYRRLRLVMDYWCALWFWPIEQADLLPTREEYLFDLSLILEGKVVDVAVGPDEHLPLFSDTQPEREARAMVDEHGFVNVDRLCEQFPRLELVRELAVDRYRFLHWELEFADLFAERKGFDLVLGNPPWKRLRVELAPSLAAFSPALLLQGGNSKELEGKVLEVARNIPDARRQLMNEATSVIGQRSHLSSTLYPRARTTKVNYYKAFIERCIELTSGAGLVSLLHDTGIFDETGADEYREWMFSRLVHCFRFINQLNHFPEEALGHAGHFAITALSNRVRDFSFDFICSVFHPVTIEQSYSRREDVGSMGSIPPTKASDGWVLRGHPDRLIRYDRETMLAVSDRSTDGSPELGGPLKSLYARPMLRLVTGMRHARCLRDVCELSGSSTFDENSATRSGLLVKGTTWPQDRAHTVLSSPHFYVGSPLVKVPNAKCKSKGDYSVLDISEIRESYLPRTLFSLSSEVRRDDVDVSADGSSLDSFRLAWRTWVSAENERTLISCIIPPQVMHVYPVHSATLPSPRDLLVFAGLTFSIVYDYLIRVQGIDHVWAGHLGALPFPRSMDGPVGDEVAIHALRLSCITEHYRQLWESFLGPEQPWCREEAFLTDLGRRRALVELDVLSAYALGLALSDLNLVYTVQFPTLYQNEASTWYDQRGRVTFTRNRNLSGVGFPRNADPKRGEPIGWEDIRDMKTGTVARTIIDDTLPGGPREHTITYQAPFDRCDRERDYEVAWAEFTRRFEEPAAPIGPPTPGGGKT